MSATPPPYSRQASFTNFHTEPAPTVGQDLEAEFNKVKTSLDATQSRLSEIQRDDGLLANLSVHPDALSNAVRALLSIHGDIRGLWVTGLVYGLGDVIEGPDGITYLSTVEHVANASFTVDVNAGRWISIDSGINLDAELRADIVDGSIEGPLRADLASSTVNKGAEQVGYRDTLAPAFLKTTSDIINGVPVSVLRAIDRTKHAGIFAGTDVTDVAPGVNALLAAMGAAGRGHLVHEAGTINIGTALSQPADVLFTGGGVKSVIKPLAVMTSMLSLTGDYAQVRDLNLQNVSSRATRGISVTSPFFAKVLDNYLGGFTHAIYVDGAQKGWIERNHTLNCSFGAFLNNDGREFRILSNHFQGGTGIWVGKTTQQCEGLKVAFNTVLPSVTADPNSGYGIVVLAGLEIQMLSNMLGNVDKNGILLAGLGGNAVSAVKIGYSWVDNDTGVAGAEGLLIYGNVSDVTVHDVTFANANQRGVHIGLAAEAAPQRIRLRDLKFLNCATGDMQLEKGTDIEVSGITFVHATSQLREEVNTITGRVHECTFTVAPSPKSTGLKHYNNTGPAAASDDHGQATPAITNIANVTASSWEGSGLTWSRTGDTVNFAGRINVTPTAAAGTLTQVSFLPPATTNWDDHGDLGGCGSAFGSSEANSPKIFVSGDGGTDKITLSFYAPVNTSLPISFSGSFRVLP